VFSFPNPVTVTGASVTPHRGKLGHVEGSPIVSPDGRTVTVNLTNVSDAQTMSVTLTGVNNGTTTHNVTAQMSIYVGDTNGNSVVNASDVSQTKTSVGQLVTVSNFRSDVAVNGTINASDVALVKSHSGTP
jgi:hypothetical protein